ncbi:cytochrome b subunit of succinate dehydrogenase, Sdh3p [Friedmanniomyces endolithicus]|nr:cytochrome b subunit of succinate dehydrogenase, Sdh3p [Friedmanniomyces endolithicus]
MKENDAGTSILARQRLNRPVAPHLMIYKAQITWYLSGLNRITGCLLSGGFYVFGALYLVAPYIGWHLETAVLAAAFAKWPAVLKVGAKVFNGVRHLTWDTASMIDNKKVNQTGWTVVGLTVVSALLLAFL